MSNRTIRQNVIDELDFDPSIDAAGIGVAVEDGIVTLSGHVASYTERVAAEKATRKVRGVRGVLEEIKVRFAGDKPQRRGPGPPGGADARLGCDRAEERGAGEGAGRLVTLTGEVEWQYQKEEARAALKRLTGVAGIVNMIDVTPRADAADVRKKIEAALKRSAEVEADAIQVTVKDAQVTLEGKVHAWHELRLAETAAWSAPGVRTVVDRLTVA